MTTSKDELEIDFRSEPEQIDETIRIIEKEGWDASEILFEDIQDLLLAMSKGRDTKSQYEYVRDLLTYLINKEEYWLKN